MLKQRIITLSSSMLLAVSAFTINKLQSIHILPLSIFAQLMLVITAIYLVAGCMLQNFGLADAAKVLSIVIFSVLCVCLFYSVTLVDFIAFFVCMAFLLSKTSRICSCKVS